MDDTTADTVAAASAECGMQMIANWVPANLHAELRELLYDLVFTALRVHAERPWKVPGPSPN
ncbi:MAG: hypothetical protein C0501_21270 [Isosphaera sp.]|nr:hypothetical protein [Isosphaera sp.]